MRTTIQWRNGPPLWFLEAAIEHERLKKARLRMDITVEEAGKRIRFHAHGMLGGQDYPIDGVPTFTSSISDKINARVDPNNVADFLVSRVPGFEKEDITFTVDCEADVDLGTGPERIKTLKAETANCTFKSLEADMVVLDANVEDDV